MLVSYENDELGIYSEFSWTKTKQKIRKKCNRRIQLILHESVWLNSESKFTRIYRFNGKFQFREISSALAGEQGTIWLGINNRLPHHLSGSLMPKSRGWELYKTRKGKAGGVECRYPSPDKTTYGNHQQGGTSSQSNFGYHKSIELRDWTTGHDTRFTHNQGEPNEPSRNAPTPHGSWSTPTSSYTQTSS